MADKKVQDTPETPDYIVILEESEREFQKRIDSELKRGYKIHSQSQRGDWQFSALLWRQK